MMSSLSILVLIVIVGWFWVDSLRAREIGSQISRNMCAQHQLQWLDDSLVLCGIKLTRNTQGRWAMQRRYQFEFSKDGNSRQLGTLTLIGHQLAMIELPGILPLTISL